MSDHHFGSGSFTKELWIANKRVFQNCSGVDVEFVTPGTFDWIIADASGKEVKSVAHINKTGGWTSIDLPSQGLYGHYSVGFRNTSGGTKEIKQGDVYFK
ncbi:hypothetical protein M527_02440 [Sphingobium indicum IP26]|uniref:hypothetical protein n=2 Tax=Sphingobium TaxID=165695 RepID=UPI0003781B73|nr:hypothetical protein M527_02440 [Sphingobium indicum IP26]